MTLDTQIAKEWDQLGFYYEYDDELKQWRFIGSKQGLSQLINIIIDYTSNKSNNGLSEHIHLGPYSYLKIITWNEPIITKDYIAGAPDDLKMLASLITGKLKVISTGNAFKIDKEYSPKNSGSLLFIVMADEFQPAVIEL